jgi:hypothetical protein
LNGALIADHLHNERDGDAPFAIQSFKRGAFIALQNR